MLTWKEIRDLAQTEADGLAADMEARGEPVLDLECEDVYYLYMYQLIREHGRPADAPEGDLVPRWVLRRFEGG
ncbi:hypothetical protein [Glycomyces sp. NPDC048151]|uniref:hypothetical protein n=1 Tax=Glycomyces sp. NPDC048151 TaxID=3364002 RepID=UPI00371A7A67